MSLIENLISLTQFLIALPSYPHTSCSFISWAIVPLEIYIDLHSHSMMNYMVTVEKVHSICVQKKCSDDKSCRTCNYCRLTDCLRSHFGSLKTHKMSTPTASNHKANNHLTHSHTYVKSAVVFIEDSFRLSTRQHHVLR